MKPFYPERMFFALKFDSFAPQWQQIPLLLIGWKSSAKNLHFKDNNEYIAHVENTFLWHREHIPEYFEEKDLIQQKYDEETTHIKQTIQADIKQLQALF